MASTMRCGAATLARTLFIRTSVTAAAVARADGVTGARTAAPVATSLLNGPTLRLYQTLGDGNGSSVVGSTTVAAATGTSVPLGAGVSATPKLTPLVHQHHVGEQALHDGSAASRERQVHAQAASLHSMSSTSRDTSGNSTVDEEATGAAAEPRQERIQQQTLHTDTSTRMRFDSPYASMPPPSAATSLTRGALTRTRNQDAAAPSYIDTLSLHNDLLESGLSREVLFS